MSFGVAMPRKWVLRIAVTSFGLFGAAAADDLPNYNLSPSCRTETSTQAADQSCLRDEQRAREALLRQWSKFPSVARANCLHVEETGGAPSYVELLTCLQMAAPATHAN